MIRVYTVDLERTVNFIKQAHAGQTDMAGRPYYLHPVAVMNSLGNVPCAVKHAALLHDVIEDTQITLDDLRRLGYAGEVVGMVRLLTRDPDTQTYAQYIDAILVSGNLGAMQVKYADAAHNNSPERRAGITDPAKLATLASLSVKRWQPTMAKMTHAINQHPNTHPPTQGA